ncbi:glutamate 5-kinase [Egicoccus halophilus]|uniref:Glutamate 5-kinase n=1 Tax=Egicoccus halophilus TaxID=1670830 RepID=A0A8J3A8G0_9ACTN|nr:glutamate 5-kinase [Egicoccus halophilus]GGI06837.1 glutamate 5-kinase [Egicoccus halophilus]
MTDGSARRFARPALCVVKVGSSSLRGHDGRLDRGQVANIAEQLVAAQQAGTRVVLVSSGAVAAGMGLLGLERRPTDLPTLQACAAVGQGELIHEYQQVLARSGRAAAQILLSQDDFVRRGRYLNARTTLRRLLELGAMPIINENDAVATEELAYGDNDHLAALVASMLDAQLLVLLSDVEGLYDADPRTSAEVGLIERVDDVDALDDASIGGVGSYVGSGGMRTKVGSARVAVRSATHTVVADARRPGVLAEVVEGGAVGTWFVAQPQRLEARRLWIGFALRAHGQVHVNDGAVHALRVGGASLLSVGVVHADGEFASGDAVEVRGPDGRLVARGLSNYSVDDLRRIAGRSTSDAAEAFGSGFAREVVHRDDLVLL